MIIPEMQHVALILYLANLYVYKIQIFIYIAIKRGLEFERTRGYMEGFGGRNGNGKMW